MSPSEYLLVSVHRSQCIFSLSKNKCLWRNFTYFTQQSLADSSWRRHCVSFSSLNVLSICIASPALCFLPQNPGSVSNGECQDILTLSLWVLCLWRRFWGGKPDTSLHVWFPELMFPPGALNLSFNSTGNQSSCSACPGTYGLYVIKWAPVTGHSLTATATVLISTFLLYLVL